jgi:hypothetical protein
MDDPRISINLNKPGADLEGNARESSDLKRGLVAPTIKTHPWPVMSEDEVYLRLNVPSGLQTNGSYPTHYGIVQKAHADPSESPIKTDDGR